MGKNWTLELLNEQHMDIESEIIWGHGIHFPATTKTETAEYPS
jgi:hypothetical protein